MRPFDQVVLALPARAAVPLLRDLPAARPLRDALATVEYVETSSLIHSDAGLMPPDRASWSSQNQLAGEASCMLSMWIGQRRRDDLYKTLAATGAAAPRRLHVHEDYHHPIMTPEYFSMQDRILALQGHGGLWVAGSYTIGFDCHETGLASAVRIARRLRPESENARRLMRMDPTPILRGGVYARVARRRYDAPRERAPLHP